MKSPTEWNGKVWQSPPTGSKRKEIKKMTIGKIIFVAIIGIWVVVGLLGAKYEQKHKNFEIKLFLALVPIIPIFALIFLKK